MYRPSLPANGHLASAVDPLRSLAEAPRYSLIAETVASARGSAVGVSVSAMWWVSTRTLMPLFRFTPQTAAERLE